jgi:glycosyltransferase involved in cell wall biosynthesis
MLKVGICHQNLARGDAIGNDIAGAYRLLEQLGLYPTILCEFHDRKLEAEFRLKTLANAQDASDSYDLLLYHHSISWALGERLIESYGGPIVLKYHNVTPPEFFAPYTTVYEQACREAQEQIKRLAQGDWVAFWQADSEFNAEELRSFGVPDGLISVVPPFNRIGELIFLSNQAHYSRDEPVKLLFVGRRVPNKGHKHLIKILHAYIELFSSSVLLQIVGREDRELRVYSAELTELASELGVSSSIDWRSHVSQEEIRELFLMSHVYLNTSEHEGFCVPLIEAQAAGLPLITFDTTASKETIGPNQLAYPVPDTEEDYDLLAGLVHEVVHNKRLRMALQLQGFLNAFTRFSGEAIENKFVASLEPILREAF